ncbi:hypothetical protein MTR_6g014950 [Medicago truncatula]|uniref:Uncharacterized protein n=1 Tax=Medicago truncatula TaxID=3880 RepID=G7KMD1_MEDTR|nr:hypothetical protein MTR_6g014950 [Medicago truncatula]
MINFLSMSPILMNDDVVNVCICQYTNKNLRLNVGKVADLTYWESATQMIADVFKPFKTFCIFLPKIGT